MKTKDLAYYPKFIFIEEKIGYCISTTDIECLKLVRQKGSEEGIQSLKIGNQITFDNEDDLVFTIIDIQITHIWEDLSYFRYGMDSNDCMQQNGELKQEILKIKVYLEKV